MDLSKLNPPQRDAVTHGSGPLMVLAGAGSGKTRVITQRIVHLLGRGVPARSIAALTFTNKAAEEMRERVAALLGDRKRAAELTMGTFHSLGLSILKSERDALGFPRGFVIYDTADQLGVIRELLRRTSAGRRFDVKAILTRISLAKNAFISPEEYTADTVDEYDEITELVYPKYESALRAFAAVDFDDLITAPVRLFQGDERIAKSWRERFLHVLVDEFQDTNRAQMLMVQHLVADHENLCVVGDDDQSIYSWRGADPRNILEFAHTYPKAKVVKLEQNYRSTPVILDAANAVIAHNTQRHGKELWSDRARGECISHVVAPTAEAEARFVAEEIDRVREGTTYRYKDIAVLYRSNKQTALVEEELRTRRIPYVMYGGQQFFERKEVKDVIAYLRAALNQRDEISLRRIINYPARGIGQSTLSKLTLKAAAEHTSLWRATERAASESELSGPAWRAVHSFVELMSEFRDRLAHTTDIVAEVDWLVEKIDLVGDIRAASPNMKAAQRRIDNLGTLKRSLARHQESAGGRLDGLSEFLRQLSLDSKDEEEVDVGNRVILTTLHGAKGLEFPVVFLIGAEEELLPHARTLMPIATDVIDPEHCTDVSEERRLAYVGITRAKDKLYLCRCSHRRLRGKIVPRTPSRFLMEIPEDLLEHRNVAAEAREAVPTDEVKNFFAQMGGLDFD